MSVAYERLKEEPVSPIWGLAAFLLLFLWKYPMDGFFDSGVRPDDIVLALILVIVTFQMLANQGRFVFPISGRLLVLFSVWGIFSVLISVTQESGISPVAGTLFSIRHLEYFIAFYIGINLSYREFCKLAGAYIIYATVIVLFQKLGYLGFATPYNVVDRQMANMAGPWELAVVASGLGVLFIHERKWFLAAAAIFCLVSTESRITFVMFSLVVGYNFLAQSRYRYAERIIMGIGILMLLSITLLSFLLLVDHRMYDLAQQEGVIGRIASLENAIELDVSVKDLQSNTTSAEFASRDLAWIKGSFNSVSIDLSAFSRFSRWVLAISTILSYPTIIYFTGVGPSFYGLALDGGLLRIVLTTGLIGGIIYSLFVVQLFRMSRNYNVFFSYLVIYFGSSIFIDVNYSLKPTVLLWLIAGVYSRVNQTRMVGT